MPRKTGDGCTLTQQRRPIDNNPAMLSKALRGVRHVCGYRRFDRARWPIGSSREPHSSAIRPQFVCLIHASSIAGTAFIRDCRRIVTDA
jgi:hypothetical protein